MINELTRLLRGDEGEVLHAYQDHLGYWTIGVGRLIDKRKGSGISTAESALLLGNDIAEKEAELDRWLPWWRQLPDARRAVLLPWRSSWASTACWASRTPWPWSRSGISTAPRAACWLASGRARRRSARRMSEHMRSNAWHYKEGI